MTPFRDTARLKLGQLLRDCTAQYPRRKAVIFGNFRWQDRPAAKTRLVLWLSSADSLVYRTNYRSFVVPASALKNPQATLQHVEPTSRINHSYSQPKDFLCNFPHSSGHKGVCTTEVIRGSTSLEYFTLQTKPHTYISWSTANTLHNKGKYRTEPSVLSSSPVLLFTLLCPIPKDLLFLRRTNMDDLKTWTFLRTLSPPHVWSKCLLKLVATLYTTKAMWSSLHVCRLTSPSYIENNRRSTWHKNEETSLRLREEWQ
jgi:hypothetical protein